MQLLVIDPNIVGTAFAWLLLLSGLGTVVYFIWGTNKSETIKNR